MLGLIAPRAAFAQDQNLSAAQQQQLESVRTAGYNAGFRDGVNDYRSHAPYSFQSHPVYQNAGQNDNAGSGVSQQAYASAFRAAYQNGYQSGFYGENGNGAATASGSGYSGAPAYPASAAGAQTTPTATGNAQPGTTVASTTALPAGTALALKLDTPLSTSNSTAGETFTATVTNPVYGSNGQAVLVPQGSTVTGRVASVKRSGGVSGESQLQLQFESLRLPDGSVHPLRAQLSNVNPNGGVGGAITGTPSATNEGGVQQSQTRNTVGTAAAGGAVGALIGAIAGGGKGAGIGGLVGAGLGVVFATQNGNLNLPAGTPMTITLSQPVEIR